MTTAQILITVGVLALGTIITRAAPFVLFPQGRPTPRFVLYLGKVLPSATMGLLIVFCLKDVAVAAWPHGLPELIAIAAVVGLQLWRRNTLISIAGGTVLYMVLVQLVF